MRKWTIARILIAYMMKHQGELIHYSDMMQVRMWAITELKLHHNVDSYSRAFRTVREFNNGRLKKNGITLKNVTKIYSERGEDTWKIVKFEHEPTTFF